MLANSPNHLKQGISLNHKPWKNFQSKAKLSTPRTIETLGSQASKPLVTPVRGEGDEVKRREKSEAKPIGKSIHLLERNNHRA